MDWHTYKSTLAISSESALHPHSALERGDLFSAVSFEGMELEYLDLLHSLVLVQKPVLVLETGTNVGLSAMALGFALKKNHESGARGHLYSLEQDGDVAHQAENSVIQSGLSDFVTIVTTDSVDFIRQASALRFEMVFFDSARRVRPREFQALVLGGSLVPGCLLAFHDTSPLRAHSMPHQAESQRDYLAALTEIGLVCGGGIRFPFSRGLSLFQWGAATAAPEVLDEGVY